MATHIRHNVTIEDFSDICDTITASLESDPSTTMLSEPWKKFTLRADDLFTSQRSINRNLRRARAAVVVRSAQWDSQIAAFGRAVVDASNGKRDISPYTRFFREMTPSEAQRLGAEKKTLFGDECLKELGRNSQEALATVWITRLGAANQGLLAAFEGRTSAESKQKSLDTSHKLLLDEVNLALDILEGDLLKTFPGDSKRVASYISATKYTPPSANVPKTTDPEKKNSAEESTAEKK
jgi:hypothetical protein